MLRFEPELGPPRVAAFAIAAVAVVAAAEVATAAGAQLHRTTRASRPSLS